MSRFKMGWLADKPSRNPHNYKARTFGRVPRDSVNVSIALRALLLSQITPTRLDVRLSARSLLCFKLPQHQDTVIKSAHTETPTPFIARPRFYQNLTGNSTVRELPLNDDEIAFVAGERIEVLERDDAYGDGWWTGRNLAGHEGIFPRDYTTPAGPLIPELRTPGGTAVQELGPPGHSTSSFHSGNYGSVLHPLTEENESDTALGPSNGRLNDPSNYQKTNNLANGGGQVMAATMTDIQHAIDQLGVKRSYSTLTDDRMTDDRRSVSFVSTRDDRTSIYDHEGRLDEGRRDSMYEGEDGMDVTPGGNTNRVTLNEEWHRNARRRLFEKVDEMDAEARRKAEEEEAAYTNNYHRPPVEVEFSDESEDEDGHHHHHHNAPPNDLLSRIQHKHDDSIPSTLPSTFIGDHSTTSLPFVKDDGTENVGVPSAAVNGRHLTDSPAKADSPTLAISRHETLESNRIDLSTSPPDAEAQDKRSITPVPSKKSDDPLQKAKDLSIPNIGKPPNEPMEAKRDSPEFLPNFAPTSPFDPSPFAPTIPGTADSRTQGDYPISSSTIYPATQASRDASPSQPVSKSPSYISFLPSPTAATFAHAPGGNMDQPPVSSEGFSQSQSQSSVPEKVINEVDHSVRANDVISSQARQPIGQTAVVPLTTSGSLLPPSSNVPSSQASPQSTKKVPVSEWTVDQVVDWIRSKGFDEGICKKFIGEYSNELCPLLIMTVRIEHEITGDVLLEFDANMLKEIDIVAFGKRVKIANAINELRRPPSFESSDAASLKPSVSQFSMVGNQSTYSSVPQSVSVPQLAAAPGHGHSLSH
ncbi:12224_t:CDS:2, partial [Acaulospora colombiana]